MVYEYIISYAEENVKNHYYLFYFKNATFDHPTEWLLCNIENFFKIVLTFHISIDFIF